MNKRYKQVIFLDFGIYAMFIFLLKETHYTQANLQNV